TTSRSGTASRATPTSSSATRTTAPTRWSARSAATSTTSLHGRNCRGELVEGRQVGGPERLQFGELLVDLLRHFVAHGDVLRGRRPSADLRRVGHRGELVVQAHGIVQRILRALASCL